MSEQYGKLLTTKQEEKKLEYNKTLDNFYEKVSAFSQNMNSIGSYNKVLEKIGQYGTISLSAFSKALSGGLQSINNLGAGILDYFLSFASTSELAQESRRQDLKDNKITLKEYNDSETKFDYWAKERVKKYGNDVVEFAQAITDIIGSAYGFIGQASGSQEMIDRSFSIKDWSNEHWGRRKAEIYGIETRDRPFEDIKNEYLSRTLTGADSAIQDMYDWVGKQNIKIDDFITGWSDNLFESTLNYQKDIDGNYILDENGTPILTKDSQLAIETKSFTDGVFQSVGNMLPELVLAYATKKTSNPQMVKALSMTMFGTGCYSQALQQGLGAGLSIDDARKYAMATATTEVSTEYMFGWVGVEAPTLKPLEIVSEGLEEVMADIMEYGNEDYYGIGDGSSKKALGGRDKTSWILDEGMTFASGLAMSMVMGGTSKVVRGVENIVDKKVGINDNLQQVYQRYDYINNAKNKTLAKYETKQLGKNLNSIVDALNSNKMQKQFKTLENQKSIDDMFKENPLLSELIYKKQITDANSKVSKTQYALTDLGERYQQGNYDTYQVGSNEVISKENGYATNVGDSNALLDKITIVNKENTISEEKINILKQVEVNKSEVYKNVQESLDNLGISNYVMVEVKNTDEAFFTDAFGNTYVNVASSEWSNNKNITLANNLNFQKAIRIITKAGQVDTKLGNTISKLFKKSGATLDEMFNQLDEKTKESLATYLGYESFVELDNRLNVEIPNNIRNSAKATYYSKEVQLDEETNARIDKYVESIVGIEKSKTLLQLLSSPQSLAKIISNNDIRKLSSLFANNEYYKSIISNINDVDLIKKLNQIKDSFAKVFAKTKTVVDLYDATHNPLVIKDQILSETNITESANYKYVKEFNEKYPQSSFSTNVSSRYSISKQVEKNGYKVFNKELTNEQAKAKRELDKIISKMNKVSKGEVQYVIVDSNNSLNGAFSDNSNTIFIDYRTLTLEGNKVFSNIYGVVFHEYGHQMFGKNSLDKIDALYNYINNIVLKDGKTIKELALDKMASYFGEEFKVSKEEFSKWLNYPNRKGDVEFYKAYEEFISQCMETICNDSIFIESFAIEFENATSNLLTRFFSMLKNMGKGKENTFVRKTLTKYFDVLKENGKTYNKEYQEIRDISKSGIDKFSKVNENNKIEMAINVAPFFETRLNYREGIESHKKVFEEMEEFIAGLSEDCDIKVITKEALGIYGKTKSAEISHKIFVDGTMDNIKRFAFLMADYGAFEVQDGVLIQTYNLDTDESNAVEYTIYVEDEEKAFNIFKKNGIDGTMIIGEGKIEITYGGWFDVSQERFENKIDKFIEKLNKKKLLRRNENGEQFEKRNIQSELYDRQNRKEAYEVWNQDSEDERQSRPGLYHHLATAERNLKIAIEAGEKEVTLTRKDFDLSTIESLSKVRKTALDNFDFVVETNISSDIATLNDYISSINNIDISTKNFNIEQDHALEYELNALLEYDNEDIKNNRNDIYPTNIVNEFASYIMGKYYDNSIEIDTKKYETLKKQAITYIQKNIKQLEQDKKDFSEGYKLFNDVVDKFNLYISISPYSNSIYAHKEGEAIDWDDKPNDSFRLSNHWNFMSRGQIHCKSNSANNEWYLSIFDIEEESYKRIDNIDDLKFSKSNETIVELDNSVNDFMRQLYEGIENDDFDLGELDFGNENENKEFIEFINNNIDPSSNDLLAKAPRGNPLGKYRKDFNPNTDIIDIKMLNSIGFFYSDKFDESSDRYHNFVNAGNRLSNALILHFEMLSNMLDENISIDKLKQITKLYYYLSKNDYKLLDSYSDFETLFGQFLENAQEYYYDEEPNVDDWVEDVLDAIDDFKSKFRDFVEENPNGFGLPLETPIVQEANDEPFNNNVENVLRDRLNITNVVPTLVSQIEREKAYRNIVFEPTYDYFSTSVAMKEETPNIDIVNEDMNDIFIRSKNSSKADSFENDTINLIRERKDLQKELNNIRYTSVPFFNEFVNGTSKVFSYFFKGDALNRKGFLKNQMALVVENVYNGYAKIYKEYIDNLFEVDKTKKKITKEDIDNFTITYEQAKNLIERAYKSMFTAQEYCDTYLKSENYVIMDDASASFNPDGFLYHTLQYWGIRGIETLYKLNEVEFDKEKGSYEYASETNYKDKFINDIAFGILNMIDVTNGSSANGRFLDNRIERILEKFFENTQVNYLNPYSLKEGHMMESLYKVKEDVYQDLRVRNVVNDNSAKGQKDRKLELFMCDPYTVFDIASNHQANSFYNVFYQRVIYSEERATRVKLLLSNMSSNLQKKYKQELRNMNTTMCEKIEPTIMKVKDVNEGVELNQGQLVELYLELRREYIRNMAIEHLAYDDCVITEVARKTYHLINNDIEIKDEKGNSTFVQIVNTKEALRKLKEIILKNDFLKDFVLETQKYLRGATKYANSTLVECEGRELTDDGIIISKILSGELATNGNLEDFKKSVGLYEKTNKNYNEFDIDEEDIKYMYTPFSVQIDSLYNADAISFGKDSYLTISDSLTQSLLENSEKVVITSMSNHLTRYTKRLSNYYGYFETIRGFNDLINSTIENLEVAEEDNDIVLRDKKITDKRVDSYIPSIYKDYIKSFLEDTLGIARPKKKGDNIVSFTKQAFYTSALAGNVKVIATQFASMINNANVFGGDLDSNIFGDYFKSKFFLGRCVKNFMKVLFAKKTQGEEIQALRDNSALFTDREQDANASLFELEEAINKQGALDVRAITQLKEFLMSFIGKTDSFINEAFYLTLRETTNPKTNEVYTKEEASQLVNESILKTQSSALSITKPEALRTNNHLIQIMFAFMGEPMKLISQYTNAFDYYKTSSSKNMNKIIERIEKDKESVQTSIANQLVLVDKKIDEIKLKILEYDEKVKELKKQFNDVVRKAEKDATTGHPIIETLPKKDQVEVKRIAKEFRQAKKESNQLILEQNKWEEIQEQFTGKAVSENIFYENTKKESQEYAKEHKKATRKLVQTTRLLVESILFTSFIDLFFQVIRSALRDKKEDENIGEYLINNYALCILNQTISMIPILKDIYNTIHSSYRSNQISYFTNPVKAIQSIYNLTMDIVRGEDARSDISKTLKYVGQTFGIPLGNLEKLIKTPLGWFDDTHYWYSQITGTNINETQLITNAIEKGNTKLVQTYISDKMDSALLIMSATNISEIGRLKTAKQKINIPKLNDSYTINGIEYIISKAQKEEMKKIYATADDVIAKLTINIDYKMLSDEYKAKVINAILSYYYRKAKQDVLGASIIAENNYFARTSDAIKYFMGLCKKYRKQKKSSN